MTYWENLENIFPENHFRSLERRRVLCTPPALSDGSAIQCSRQVGARSCSGRSVGLARTKPLCVKGRGRREAEVVEDVEKPLMRNLLVGKSINLPFPAA